MATAFFLKDYQEKAVDFAVKNFYCILALDPGLGKTLCAIETRNRLNLNCLVICPSYLILNWKKELTKWSPESNVTIFKSGKQIYEVVDTDFILISYDLVQKAQHLFEWADMVVLDEAPAIKSMKAKRTEFIHKNVYENSIKHLLLLTGTPIKNRVQEFYSLLALCNYNPAEPESKFLDQYPDEITFADKFSYRQNFDIQLKNGQRIPIIKWTGLKDVEELKTHLDGKYFRVKSSDVLDLPPVIYKDFFVSEADDEDLIKEFYNYFDDPDEYKHLYYEDPEEYNDLKKKSTSSVMPNAKMNAALKKVPFTIKYATDLLEETDCILIYSDHVLAAEEIAKAFGTTALTGKIQASRRSQMADDFQNGTGKVLVATIGSMKEGKDLFRANHIIFNDICWVPMDLKQVVYRIQRLGQKRHCTVHRVLGSPQDYQILKTLEEKIEVIERAT